MTLFQILKKIYKTIIDSLYNFSLEQGIEKPYANIITISYCIFILTIFFNHIEPGVHPIIAVILMFVALLINFIVSILAWKKVDINIIESMVSFIFPIICVLFLFFTGGYDSKFLFCIVLIPVVLPLYFSLKVVMVNVSLISLFYAIMYFTETKTINLSELFVIIMNIYVFFLIALLVSSAVRKEKLLNEKLQSANRELEEVHLQKSKFLSDISHDLKNPVTTILTLSEKLESTKTENHNYYLSLIKKESYRLLNLIRNSFNLSEIEQGKFRVNKEQIDIVDLMLYIIQIYKSQSYSLSLKIDYNIPPIYGDREKIMQVIHNIINNAIKYSSENPKIKITIAKIDNYVSIAFMDRGIGIPKDNLAHIFDRFYRGNNAKNIVGSGLGLHISKYITEAHSGKIEVTSKEGRGTTFTIYLPCLN